MGSQAQRCGDAWRKPVHAISDRAKRYRANTPECKPAGPKICEYCGSKNDVGVHHRDGNESNMTRRNLGWACRSDNIRIANEMKRRGRGRRVSQSNPATTLAQWVTAVLSMKGESDAIPKAEAIEIVRATPAADRSKFAREIWHRRRSGGRSFNPAELLIFGNPTHACQTCRHPKSKHPDGGACTYSRLLGSRKWGRRLEECTCKKYVPSASNPSLYDAIRPGSRVTIVNRFGQSHSGRAVMRGPHGWVLNMSGAHGTPAIATPENVTKVSGGRAGNSAKYPNDPPGYAKRVRELEAEGLSTSDAQGVADVELRRPRPVKHTSNPKPIIFALRRVGHYGVGLEEWAFTADGDNQTVVLKKGTTKTVAKKAAITEAEARRRLVPRLRHLANPKRNPSDTEQAVRLFGIFHGRKAQEIIEKQESAAMRLDYTALGDLDYLKVHTPQDEKMQLDFEGDGVKLASSPDGKQLYLIGGNQNLSACLDADSLQKDFVDLGEAFEVQYVARKIHGDFQPIAYFHKFGEKNGALPRLMYDKLRRRIFFVGGEYFIDTTNKVSPGIEN